MWADALQAWRLGIAAIRQFSQLFVLTVVVSIVIKMLSELVGAPVSSAATPTAGSFLLVALLTIPYVLAQVPLAIAVHRYVVMGETSGAGAFDWPRVRRFGVLGLVSALVLHVTMVPLFVPGLSLLARTILNLIAAIVVGVFLVRASLIFPAIAVSYGAPTIQQSLADTSGKFWRIVLTYILSVLPLIGPVIVIDIILGPGHASRIFSASGWVGMIFNAPLNSLFAVVGIAMLSVFYMRFANALKAEA